VEAGSAVLGVSIRPLPGLFQRTRAVTLFPRFVVVNQLSFPIELLPLRCPPPSSSAPPSSSRRPPSSLAEDQHSPSPEAEDAIPQKQCTASLAPSECFALYSFLGLQHLPPSLPLPPGSLREAAAARGEDEGEGTRAICLRLGGKEHEGQGLCFSQPIAVEEVRRAKVGQVQREEGNADRAIRCRL
jgi:hypothetical protein